MSIDRQFISRENMVKLMDQPHARMFRFGAGWFLLCVISLLSWWLTGTGMPFHPIFAILGTPTSIIVVIMSFMIKSAALKEPITCSCPHCGTEKECTASWR